MPYTSLAIKPPAPVCPSQPCLTCPHNPPPSVLQVIGLWLVVLAPWRSTSYSDTLALQQTLDSVRAAADSRAQRIAAGGSGSLAAGGLGGGAGGAGIFGGGMLSASAAAKLNRWGSEMVHVATTLGHVGQHGEGGEYRGGGAQVRAQDTHRRLRTPAQVVQPEPGPHCLPAYTSNSSHPSMSTRIAAAAAAAVAQPAKYTRVWRAHVWAHLPFYTILLPAFLELCYSQTAYSSKMALNNVYRVSGLAQWKRGGSKRRGDRSCCCQLGACGNRSGTPWLSC